MLAYVSVTRAHRNLDRGSLSWIDDHQPAEQLPLAVEAAPAAPAPVHITVTGDTAAWLHDQAVAGGIDPADVGRGLLEAMRTQEHVPPSASSPARIAAASYPVSIADGVANGSTTNGSTRHPNQAGQQQLASFPCSVDR